MSDKPTPGSPAAVFGGCRCPQVSIADAGRVWVAADCPLHGEAYEEQYRADEREGILGEDVAEVD